MNTTIYFIDSALKTINEKYGISFKWKKRPIKISVYKVAHIIQSLHPKTQGGGRNRERLSKSAGHCPGRHRNTNLIRI